MARSRRKAQPTFRHNLSAYRKVRNGARWSEIHQMRVRVNPPQLWTDKLALPERKATFRRIGSNVS